MAPTALDKLQESRNTVKYNIGLIEQKVANHSTVPITLVKVTVYIEHLETAQTRLLDIHEKIIAIVDPADLDPHKTEYLALYDRGLEASCALKELKDQLCVASSTQPSSQSSEIRLPRLALPSFSGDIQQWSSFRDIFQSTVKNNVSISNALKLVHLKSALSGEASRLIQSIPLTNDNFDNAWAQLLHRYENERELLFIILNRLFQQQNVQIQSASSLRSLIDTTNECIHSLKSLKRPVDQWDDVILFQMFRRLDQISRELWEQSLQDSSIPTLSKFMEFLEARARGLAASQPNSHKQVKSDIGSFNRRSSTHQVHHAQASGTQSTSEVCGVCSVSSHSLYHCSKFIGMQITDRMELLKKLSLCFNCLRPGHSCQSCPSKGCCKKCQKRHNTLVHKDQVVQPHNETPGFTRVNTTIMHTSGDSFVQQTMLATAVINVHNPRSSIIHQQMFRAMEDGCSNSNYISESCVQTLGLSRRWADVEITGVGGVSLGRTKGITTITINPHFNNNVNLSVDCFILPKITGLMPEEPCDTAQWPHLHGLQLADPDYNQPSKVDILLGAGVFWYHLLDGRKCGSPDSPVALRSTFGWLVAGNLNTTSTRLTAHLTTVDVDRSLQRFWELESLSVPRRFTQEERDCEEHFQRTHSRDASGRYIVCLPFKQSHPVLGSSRVHAIRRLKQLEGRLLQQPDRYDEYRKFMDEYLNLGHMELVEDDDNDPSRYYIPHHYVLKESSTTTKLRVVFDASAKTSSGYSLNDCLMTGPTLQDSLVNLLTRFRVHPIAFTADLAKMYRQIKVSPSDSNMQRIVWRDSPQDQIKEYRLLTVTYGTASAPYLATKVLQQLATDERIAFPLASKILLTDMYVDDLMTGAANETDALEIQRQLLLLTERGGFQLRKWSSNSSTLLSALNPEMRETETMLNFDSDQTVKALGVFWNTTQDVFQFKLTFDNITPSGELTKRKLLSEVSKIFDPLGWLAPVVIQAKIMIQDLWKLEIGWDDLLPYNLQEQWIKYRSNLHHIEQIKINRCIIPAGYNEVDLYGYGDASEKAYSAVVYACSTDPNQEPKISLVSSKTRVAPIKKVSLPRLELCGSLLLSQLIDSVKESLRSTTIRSIRAFSDSTITLGWIKSNSARLPTFEANRVSEIQERVPSVQWFHVSGIDNPSDCASRGIDPDELISHPLWWDGPNWMRMCTEPPQPVITFQAPVSAKCQQSQLLCLHISSDTSFINKFSSFTKLIRTIAWIFRFTYNCVRSIHSEKQLFPLTAPSESCLTVVELHQSLLRLVRVVQQQVYHEEIQCLNRKVALPSKSAILSLSPFMDENNVLRVGGRLSNSQLPYSQQHPILLPRHHQFTKLLIESEHIKQLHAGAQLLESTIKRRFWIVRGKDTIRHVINKCVICARYSAKLQQQMMGNLPSSRVVPARPFLRCGVDFAGPFTLRAIPSRSKCTFKAYLAIFICFTTRAVHLEVVSSLSSEAFLATFRRFVSRRGKPSDIYSDCGTNFVGAAKEMKEVSKFLQIPANNNTIANELSKDFIQWHFNPAGAPHMGGLWEAGVKSVKFHLYRIMGSSRLTFEELTTAMAQIEACLNSRPLCPVSVDPNDFSVLTPGHFLVGAPLTAVPELSLTDVKEGRLSRWQLVQKMTQHFWRRWSGEYISRMQQRPKWLQQSNKIKLNSLVLIKDERYPPLKWKLGRVTELHPGTDGLVRVVSLRTAEGEFQRPVVKVCLLPIESETQSDSI